MATSGVTPTAARKASKFSWLIILQVPSMGKILLFLPHGGSSITFHGSSTSTPFIVKLLLMLLAFRTTFKVFRANNRKIGKSFCVCFEVACVAHLCSASTEVQRLRRTQIYRRRRQQQHQKFGPPSAHPFAPSSVSEFEERLLPGFHPSSIFLFARKSRFSSTAAFRTFYALFCPLSGAMVRGGGGRAQTIARPNRHVDAP